MANQPPPPYPQGPYPQQAPPEKKGLSTCLIVAIVVAACGAVGVVVFASLGFYGFRRYLAAAKTAEAKNTIGAIARAAVASYERETLVGGRETHRLCRTATSVPAKVPMGVKYMPSSSPGTDFQSGTADDGWMCLRFQISSPIYYQYHYRQGSGYIAPGGAGPSGFEAAANGDLDGDGTHSTFSRTGQVVSGSVVVATTMYIDKEFE